MCYYNKHILHTYYIPGALQRPRGYKDGWTVSQPLGNYNLKYKEVTLQERAKLPNNLWNCFFSMTSKQLLWTTFTKQSWEGLGLGHQSREGESSTEEGGGSQGTEGGREEDGPRAQRLPPGQSPSAAFPSAVVSHLPKKCQSWLPVSQNTAVARLLWCNGTYFHQSIQ